MYLRALFFLLVTLCFAACSKVDNLALRLNRAVLLAENFNLTPFEVETEFFKLVGFYKVIPTATPITVYVEGDGFAWVTRSVVSDNPTPTKPMLLRLAGIDPKSNVIYLARPCQYINFKSNDAS